jgi:DNA anti-recombination protein RmuC
MVGPPLALAGQKPSDARVDGFWVPRVDAAPRKLTAGDVRLLGQWGQLLRAEVEPFEQQQDALNQEARAREDRIREELRDAREEASRTRAALNRERAARLEQVMAQSDLASAVPDYSSRDVQANQEDLRRYFREQNLSDEEAGKTLRLLSEYSSSRGTNPSGRKKTDPLLRGVDVIGDSAEELLTQ